MEALLGETVKLPVVAEILAFVRHAEVCPQIEQIILDSVEHLVDRSIGPVHVKPRDPDEGICFIDRTIRGDPQRMLGHAFAGPKSRRPLVAGSRVNLVQFDHEYSSMQGIDRHASGFDRLRTASRLQEQISDDDQNGDKL